MLFVGFPATAHHNGATYFDISTELEHSDATVVSYDLVNPHGRLVYVFMDDEGNEVEWRAELPSANNARRRGLGGDLFRPGDRLTALTGSPSRSGANFMRLTRVLFANGDVAQITGRNAGVVRAGTEWTADPGGAIRRKTGTIVSWLWKSDSQLFASRR